jgi:hypothetical protein
VFDIDKRCEAPALLCLRNDSERKRCFARRFRAENFDHSSPRKSTHPERAIYQNIAGRDDIDINDFLPAQTHDRTFSVVFRDLLDRQIEILISRSIQFVTGCFFFGLRRHIREL